MKDFIACLKEITPVPQMRAAVLLPLVEIDGAYHLLYEVRAYDLAGQPGEVCFPGGHLEAGEDIVACAVRETCEELYLDVSDIEVLSVLSMGEDPHYAGVGVCIGLLHKVPETYQSSEVDHLFTVPLSWFCDHEPDVYRIRQEITPVEPFPYELIPGGHDYPWHRTIRTVYFYQGLDESLWGMTAAMTYHFIERLKEREGQ